MEECWDKQTKSNSVVLHKVQQCKGHRWGWWLGYTQLSSPRPQFFPLSILEQLLLLVGTIPHKAQS